MAREANPTDPTGMNLSISTYLAVDRTSARPVLSRTLLYVYFNLSIGTKMGFGIFVKMTRA
jgi:hypothetical protein